MPDRVTRKGNRDVDPDEMGRRYDAGEQGAGSTSIGDEIDGAYADGLAAGQRSSSSSPASSSSRGVTFQRPGRPPSIAAPFAVELVLITVDEIRNHHRPPVPSRMLVAFALFGVLGMASGDAAPAANALGWGLVVATLLSSGGKSGQGGAIGALNTLGDFIGGKYAPRGSSTTGPTKSKKP